MKEELNAIEKGATWELITPPIECRPIGLKWVFDGSFSCVVKTQKRFSNKIYKTKITKIRYNNQLLCKYRLDPQRAVLTLIVELAW